MPEETNGSNSPSSRLDRLERIVEVLANTKLTAEVTKLAEAQKRTDEQLNALIAVVDDIVRRQPLRP